VPTSPLYPLSSVFAPVHGVFKRGFAPLLVIPPLLGGDGHTVGDVNKPSLVKILVLYIKIDVEYTRGKEKG
jgi:hypothetical protein